MFDDVLYHCMICKNSLVMWWFICIYLYVLGFFLSFTLFFPKKHYQKPERQTSIEEKRNYVVAELLETEKSYVEALKMIQEVHNLLHTYKGPSCSKGSYTYLMNKSLSSG